MNKDEEVHFSEESDTEYVNKSDQSASGSDKNDDDEEEEEGQDILLDSNKFAALDSDDWWLNLPYNFKQIFFKLKGTVYKLK